MQMRYDISTSDAIIGFMKNNILVQCDFDGTVTYKDVSFLLLDAFVGFEWHNYLEQYQDGKISVGEFSRLSFGMVKASREEMLAYIKDRTRIRQGFLQFVQTCRQKDYRFVIVSNGLDFYIDEILKGLGLSDVEYHAAETNFNPAGLKVRYVSHEGKELDSDFKLSYVQKFTNEGHRLIYIGDGNSDFVPAQKAQHVFATDSLLRRCNHHEFPCNSFENFFDIIKKMETW
jgi:2-hydroxy-3-keto-5-methylthiopentenyl-1-phosphate phosphatase